MVVKVDQLEIRFVLPHAALSIEMVGAVDRLATASAEWKQAVRQLATDQHTLPR